MDILNCYERNHNDHGTDILIFFIFILHHSVFVAMGYKVESKKRKICWKFPNLDFLRWWRIPTKNRKKIDELEHFTHFNTNSWTVARLTYTFNKTVDTNLIQSTSDLSTLNSNKDLRRGEIYRSSPVSYFSCSKKTKHCRIPVKNSGSSLPALIPECELCGR